MRNSLFAIALSCLGVSLLPAQTAEIRYFQGMMLPGNETPPHPELQANAVGTIVAHVVRDASGTITSGSVDFIIDYKFPGAVTITGLHIHRGAAGVSGAIVIPTNVGAPDPVTDSSGQGHLERQAEILPSPTDTAGMSALQALQDLFTDPSQFYVNLHTPDYPAGAVRAQLTRATNERLMAIMTPNNEVPPHPDLDASAVAAVQVIAAHDTSGTLLSSLVRFEAKYRFAAPANLTGFHIHTGAAGTNGTIVFPTSLGSGGNSVMTDPSGAGTLVYDVVPDLTRADVRGAIEQAFSDPTQLYINLHTTQFPGGAIRSQMRRTDAYTIPVNMLPANETPPVTGLNASAPSRIVINALRGDDGSVVAGAVTFDINYRFPSATTITGLHIHNGAAGTSGVITIPTDITADNPVVSSGGFGNIFRTVIVANNDAPGVATLNSIVTTPQNQYVNLHTTVNPAGAIRAQLGAAPAGPPRIAAVINAVDDKNLTTLAPGELISLYGTNFSQFSNSLTGFNGTNIPTNYGGVMVTVGGKAAPLIYVGPNQINAQVPFETPTGSQPVVVTANGTASTAFNVTVAPVAPGIFVDPASGLGILVRNSDFSLITPQNRARANDVLLIYATGLGQTTPAVNTGQEVTFVPPSGSKTQPVTVMIGNIPANVIYSIASPDFIGLYQVAITVPTTVRGGTQNVKLTIGGVDSNTVSVPFISVD